MSKNKKQKKNNKVMQLAEKNDQKSVNRKGREKQKRREERQREQKRVEKAKNVETELAENVALNDQESVENTDKLAQEVSENDQQSEAVNEDKVFDGEESVEAQETIIEQITPEEMKDVLDNNVVEAQEGPEIEIEPSNQGEEQKRRHKHFSAFWVVIAVLAVLVLVGGVWAAIQMTGKQEDIAEVENPPEDNTAEPEEQPGGETEVPEEKPEEKPVEETPEPTPEPEPEPQPMGPIAPRPDHSAGSTVTPGSKMIALTFDDGPSAATTPRLLDILSGRGVQATFFVLGNMAQRSPEIVRREMMDGHEVASHTMYHNQLTNLSASQVRGEALEMDRIFTEILGTVPPFTRPPYGSYNAMVGSALGQPMILWSIDPRDWADRNSSVVCSRVVSAAFDGAVILVHDIHATTVDAVPCIIDNLKAQGYEFLTVSDLAAARDVPLVNGQAYFSF